MKSDKIGVDDFLVAGGTVDELRRLAVTNGVPVAGGSAGVPFDLLRVRRVTDALLNPTPEPTWLARGLIRRGERVVIAGRRGVRKSFLVMQLAALMAEGTSLFLDRFAVTTPSRVLFCHGELEPWTAEQRWQLFAPRADADNLRETFDPWFLRVVRRRVRTRDGLGSEDFLAATLDDRLTSVIETQGIEVLVIDPWAVFYLGEESSNTEMEAALAVLTDLMRRYGLAVVIAHHFRGDAVKGMSARSEPEDLWRGATRLPDWASTRITMTPATFDKSQMQRDGWDRERQRKLVKFHFLRRTEPVAEFEMKFDDNLGRFVSWEGGGGKPGVMITPAALVEKATKTRGGGWPSIKKAAAALGVSENTAKRELDAAVEAGLLRKTDGARGAVGYYMRQAP